MKTNWRFLGIWIVAGLLVSILPAQYVHDAEPPPDRVTNFSGVIPNNHFSRRSTAGANQRHSHTSPFDGPTVPSIRWVASGGLLAEVTHFAPPLIPDPAGMLVVPQQFGTGTLRYSRYSYITPTQGIVMGRVGFGPSWNRASRAPFWGRLTAVTVFNTAVYVFNANDVLTGTTDNWPVFIFAGGQYDCLIYSPSPFINVPDLNVNLGDIFSGTPIRRVAAHKTHIGTYTDGLLTYALISDTVRYDDLWGDLPNPVAVGVFWISSARGTGPVVVVDYTSFAGASSAALGAGVFNEHNDTGFIGYHDGTILMYDLTTIPYPSFANAFTVMDLSQSDLLDPNDWTSGTDPIASDSVDRPIIFNEDNTQAFVCASNSGRVYSVDALTGARLWGTRLKPGRNVPIMGGPALGKDPFGFETLYVVGRTASNRCTLFAIDVSSGNIKWEFPLQNISRCNPTVDRNGRVYLGDDRGILYAIDAGGNPIWRLNLGAPITVAPSIVLDENGTPLMLVGASNRNLFAIEERRIIEIPGSGGIGLGGTP